MDLESGGPEGDAALKRESLYQPVEAKRAKSSDRGEAESGGQPRGSEASGSGTIRPGSDVGSGPNRPDKKLKIPESRREKRAAPITWQEAVEKDLKLIDLIKAAPEPEIIGAMPTLHDTPVIAGYPETGTLADACDERTGEPLPLDKVERARGRELDKMLEHNVKTDITWEHAKKLGLKIVKSRWVDGWKPLPDDPNGVRSRCVAQEMNTHNRDDVFSGTPPLKAHRMVVSAAATAKKGRSSRRKLIARYDVSVAFFHAAATGKIAVIPPKDLNQDMLWFLNKAMNGTREASKQWSKRIVEVATGCGFSEVLSVPGLFYHQEWEITMSCHGDDFLAEGEAKELDLLDEVMLSAFETKVLPRIGPPEFGGACEKGDHLHRVIKWSEKGFTWESDPKYARDLVKWAGLEGGKAVETPTSPETGKGCREAENPLSSDEVKDFRSWTGTAICTCHKIVRRSSLRCPRSHQEWLRQQSFIC